MVNVAIDGRGTTEIEWSSWLDARAWPALDVARVPMSQPVCVLAAHPDDEILGAAGLISRLAHRGHEITIVWATAGEASHPGSTALPPAELGRIRRAESHVALARLGVTPASTYHLGLPDGKLQSCEEQLREALSRIVTHDDLVLLPWEGDGHPDHESVTLAAADLGAVRWQFPIWMWHWASPADPRVPWARLHTVAVDEPSLKAGAIQAFRSQLFPLGPAVADEAVLPPHVIARFSRPQEWFVV